MGKILHTIKYSLMLIGCYSLPVLMTNAVAEAPEKAMLKKIEVAQAALEKESNRIAKEKSRYAVKISSAQQSLQNLRKEAQSLQRAADERLISLESMKNRAEKWQDQIHYQQHLLKTFAQSTDLVNNTSDEALTDIEVIERSIAKLDELAFPKWKEHKLATQSGEIIRAQSISIGPNHWFLDSENQQGGLYESSPLQPDQISYAFNDNERDALWDLLKNKEGRITFDPTMGRAIELKNNEETLSSHVEKGGVWVLPILFFGLLSISVSILKSLQLYKLPKYSLKVIMAVEKVITSNTQDINQYLDKLFNSSNDPLRKQVEIIHQHPPSSQREDLLVANINHEKHQVEKYLDVISMTAAVAPLLGLLGTVSGMIETFKMLTLFGSGDPAAISGGISEALVTTELGLVVAIPSLIINALLSRKVKSHMHTLETTTIKFNSLDTTKAV